MTASSGKTTRSAPASRACLARRRTIRSRLPSRSPTTVLIWASASRIGIRSTGLRLSGENAAHDRRALQRPAPIPGTAATLRRLAALRRRAGGGDAARCRRRSRPLSVPGRRTRLCSTARRSSPRRGPSTPDVEPPPTVPFAEAEEAATRHVRFESDDFSDVLRLRARPEDGMRISAGAVAGRDVAAAPWVPRRSRSSSSGPRSTAPARSRSAGRAAAGRARPDGGGGAAAAATRASGASSSRWPLGEDGRKLFAATALYGETASRSAAPARPGSSPLAGPIQADSASQLLLGAARGVAIAVVLSRERKRPATRTRDGRSRARRSAVSWSGASRDPRFTSISSALREKTDEPQRGQKNRPVVVAGLALDRHRTLGNTADA